MKALSVIGLVFAAFLIFLGYSSKKTAGDVLSNAVIIGGALIAVFVGVVWLVILIKGRKNSGE